jgi:hypothetical protein
VATGKKTVEKPGLVIDKSTCLARDAPAPTSALLHTIYSRQGPNFASPQSNMTGV